MIKEVDYKWLLDNRNVSIYYEVSKPDNSNPTMVYLHGGLSNHTTLDHQKRYFNDRGIGSISIDQRGSGHSTPLTNRSDHTLELYTRDLERVLEEESIDEATIVGHSMGAMVAQQYAAEHPNQTKGLVLISGSPNFRKSFEGNSRLRRLLLSQGGKLLGKTTRACNKVRQILNLDNPPYYPNYTDEEFRSLSDFMFPFKSDGRLPYETLISGQAQMDSLADSWTTESIAPKIRAPTLIIHGDSDILVPVNTAYKLCELISTSGEPIIIPNASHGVPFQHPEEVNEAIRKFLFSRVYNT